MDNEMIERCAKAAYDCSSKLSTSDAMHIATEVIKAMREPTTIIEKVDTWSINYSSGELWSKFIDFILKYPGN